MGTTFTEAIQKQKNKQQLQARKMWIQGATKAKIAEELGITEKTAWRWIQTWRERAQKEDTTTQVYQDINTILSNVLTVYNTCSEIAKQRIISLKKEEDKDEETKIKKAREIIELVKSSVQALKILAPAQMSQCDITEQIYIALENLIER